MQAITQGDLRQSVAASEQALARGGIAVMDVGVVYVPAVAPVATRQVWLGEAMALTLEARRRATVGTMTVAELGKMLADFGWTFPPERTPGEHLIVFLSAWVQQAQQSPADPQSFNPLFLAEMAKQQQQPVDLAAGHVRPEGVWLSALELEIFTAGIERSITKTSLRTGPVDALTGWLRGLVPSAHAAAPCTELKEHFGRLGELAGDVAKTSTKRDVIKLLEEQHLISHETGHGAEAALGALAAAARIWNLIEVYRHAQLVVSLESATPVHKPTEKDPDVVATFRAQAGVSEQDLKEYEESFAAAIRNSEFGQITRDCMAALGLPEFKTIEDIAEEAEKWRIQWRLIEGSPEHATISRLSDTGNNPDDFAQLGQLRQKMKRVDRTSTEARLLVDVKGEKQKDHPGIEKSADVTAKVELLTDQGLTLETWAHAVEGGAGSPVNLGAALVDVAAGWLQ
ncbi:MAG: hypothetical protein E6J26_05165, partial [Chloroflexi bacterium]